MEKNNSKVDYGSSFNKAFRNPGLIHRIQDALNRLEIGKDLVEVDILTMAIVSYRGSAIKPLIKILHEADRDKVIALIGETTMKDIDEYMQWEQSDDIPEPLFRSPQN